MFGSDGPAGPAEHPAGANTSEDCRQQTHVPFSGGRKPTPCSVRIISMQDSNAATTATGAGGAGGGSSRRELETDRTTTTTTLVSSNAGATPPLHPLLSLVPMYGPPVLRKRLRWVDSRQQLFFLLPRHRMPACVTLSRDRQSSDLRACIPNACAIRPGKRASIFIYSLSLFSRACLSRRFSFSIVFNALYILIE